MILLPIAHRELRVAARVPRTYRARWAIAGVAVLIFGWMVFVFRNTRWLSGSETFEVFAWLAFTYCLLVGANLTADSLSGEKRDNTLGLLFLTDLRGYDVVIGKLFASSINCFFGLLAMFPVLAIPLIMGGVQFSEFWHVALNLVNTLFVSSAVGLFVSVLCRQAMPAITSANLIMLFLGFVLPLVSELLRVNGYSPAVARAIEFASPFYTQTMAMQVRPWAAASYFWPSLLCSATLGLVLLGSTCWLLPRVWQDRPGSLRTVGWRERWRRFKFGNANVSRAFRRRLLDRNPFFWVAARERVSSLGFLVLAVLVACSALWIGWRITLISPLGPFGGVLFAWTWGVALIHALLLFKIASTASHRFSVDRESGALELLLSTPFPVSRILRGQWMALARQLAAPILLVLFVHALLIWGVLTLFLLEERISLNAWELFQAIVLGDPRQIRRVDFGFVVVVRVLLLLTGAVILSWIALGWASMWIGLRTKHPRFAPWMALGLVLLPPWPIFVATAIFVNEMNPWWHEFERIQICTQIGIFLGIGHVAFICTWSAVNLYRQFRTAATDRFQPPRVGRRRLWLRRLAAGACVMTLLIAGFYQEEKWRGERAWRKLEREAAARKESLDVSSIVPPAVPDQENFALAPLFVPLFDRSANGAIARAQIEALHSLQLAGLATNTLRGGPQPHAHWGSGQTTDFRKWNDYFMGTTNSIALSAADAAAKVLDVVAALSPEIEQLREASARPFSRFPVTYEDTLSAQLPHLDILHQFVEVLKLKSCAELAVGRSDRALADVRLMLRLADAVRTEPFLTSQQRRLGFISAALRPVWEGMAQQRWKSEELVWLQKAFEQFDLLSEFRTAMRNETLLQMTFWDQIRALASGEDWSVPVIGRDSHRLIRLAYPSGWAYQNKIELYRKWEQEIGPIFDPSAGRVFPEKALALSEGRARGNFNPRMVGAVDAAENNAWTQTWIHFAIIACAVERYRLANGALPDTLEQLAPEFVAKLPHDLITGQPLLYKPQRTVSGQITLQATGWRFHEGSGAPWTW